MPVLKRLLHVFQAIYFQLQNAFYAELGNKIKTKNVFLDQVHHPVKKFWQKFLRPQKFLRAHARCGEFPLKIPKMANIPNRQAHAIWVRRSIPASSGHSRTILKIDRGRFSISRIDQIFGPNFNSNFGENAYFAQNTRFPQSYC